MSEEKKEEGDIDGILCHPERLRIVLSLNKEPMYISELSRKLEIDRGLIAYHIGLLEAHEFLNGEHEISDNGNSKGRAVHKFAVTEKGKNGLTALLDVLKGA